MRPAADLWRAVWRVLDDIGGGVEIRQCKKGHATEADVAAGMSTDFLQKDNDHADHYAGTGDTIAEHLVPAEDHRAAHREGRAWYKWVVLLAGDLQVGTTKTNEEAPDHGERTADSTRPS